VKHQRSKWQLCKGLRFSFRRRRIAFFQFRPGIEKATTNPENSVDPVKNKSLEVVAERLALKPKLICSGSRQKKIAEARALVAYLAVEETGHSAAEVARHLGVRRVNVLRAAKKGLKIGNKFDDERTV
jgi:chromosomal replication initiation ATPase DnaA